MQYSASTPGSLMLLGEYSVLSGHPAVVAAIDRRLTLSLSPRTDSRVCIDSTLGCFDTQINATHWEKPIDYIGACLESYSLPSGFNLTITSDIDSNQGLGSSGALVAALTYALSCWLQLPTDIPSLWRRGIQAIRAVQGKGSGADLAASLQGGILHFTNEPLAIRPLAATVPLCVLFSGSKLTTTDALSRPPSPQAEQLDAHSNTLVRDFLAALSDSSLREMGASWNSAHSLLRKRGVSNEHLESLTQLLRSQPGVHGAKISGSGFGDCVIGLGELGGPVLSQQEHEIGCRQLPIQIDSTGVQDE